MHTRNLLFFCVFAMSLADVVLAQTTVPLTVEEGVPLPLILTNKLPYKQNAPITARLVEPVFAFDREVIPSGTEVLGRITGFQAAPRWRRVMAILSGDLTPLREPRRSFDAIVLKSRPEERHSNSDPNVCRSGKRYARPIRPERTAAQERTRCERRRNGTRRDRRA